ncbi:hypothetical protein JHK85_007318 [Glycine max]|uniref:Uncharacterized protein n=1 Tax=Glycine max TaxID=3847 RepID=A0A0R0KH92_SOYBN|nr:hypothetical protein JHK85_007318 [Glycine max]KAG5071898.1 hypothetical protein JHK86_007109 [Glycine max]
MPKDRLTHNEMHDIKLSLIANRQKDGRIYNVPTVLEIVALFSNDSGQLQRIDELHSSYLGLQYPLLFPYDEDGYIPDILHRVTINWPKKKEELPYNQGVHISMLNGVTKALLLNIYSSINKGYDRVIVIIVHDENDATHHDEIKEYINCSCCLENICISPCETTWRIFAFPIHGRKPVVERLHFHLLGQHVQDHEEIDDVLSKPSISNSMFTSWMDTNKSFVEARNLTYAC